MGLSYKTVEWNAGAAAARPAPHHPDAAHFAELLAILRKRRKLVVAVATSFMAVVLVVLIFLPTFYSATTVVVLEDRKNAVADQSAVLSGLSVDPATIQNQIQVLTSRGLASRVIEKLGLWTDPEFNPAVSPGLIDFLSGDLWRDGAGAREHDTVINRFLRNVSVDSQGLSSSIAISFSSRSAEKSAQIANAIADSYLEAQIGQKNDAAEKASQWLADRIQELSDQVQAAEAAVEKYKQENNLTDNASGSPLVDQQIAAVNTQLVQARADLAQKQAISERVNALVKSGRGADISQVVTSPLIVQLRTQQAELVRQEAQLATRYGPLHPKIIDIRSQRQNLEEKIRQEVSRLTASAANDVAIARAQVTALENSLKSSESQLGGENMARVKLKALQVNAASTRSMYESFVTRLRETQNQAAIQSPDAEIISRALVPTSPSSPPRSLIFLGSLPASLLLGVLAALLVERYGPAFRRTTVFRLFRGLPVLAHVPGARHAHAANQVANQPHSPFAIAIDNLAAALSMHSGNGTQVIVVTSAEHGESKTAIALGLARAASRRGLRTIALDADLDWPSVAVALGRNASQRGLSEILTGQCALSRTMYRDPITPTFVLAGVRRARHSARLLGSQGMAGLIAHLRQRADLVIVDAPPVLYGGQFRFLAPLADAVLLVVLGELAQRPAVDRAIGELAVMQSPPVGIVVTA